MPIAFDRSVCCDLNETISREWLITNGRGGYAAGTVAGVLTRMQHGLLVASLQDVATPQLLLAKIDEEIVFDQRTYYLGTNEYRDGLLNPSGFVHLETFHLEEGFPVFTYRLGGIDGIMLEKRIWMAHGYNTTYIQYCVLRTAEISSSHNNTHVSGHRNTGWNNGDAAGGASNKAFGRYLEYPEAAQRVLNLTLLPFSAYRPHSQPQYGNNEWHFQVQAHNRKQDTPEEHITFPEGVAGCTIRARDGASAYSIFAMGHPDSQTTFIPTGVWYWHFLHRHDQAAGRSAVDDLYLPGVIRTKLWPDEGSTLTLIATAEDASSYTLRPNQVNLSYKRSVEKQRNVLQPQRYFGEGGETSHSLDVLPLPATFDLRIEGEEFLRLLLQAADRFLVWRTVAQNEQASNQAFFFEPQRLPVLLTDYYGMECCTRDTLIALPGLLLATRHFDEARQILRNLARFFKQGMLPDYLPLPGCPLEEPAYGSMDTTLWFFYALDHYLRASNDYELLDELYQRLVDTVDWYIRGPYNGIQVDTGDGLLRAHQPGKTFTWMNASVHGVPTTPRQGKPVEVNALWYHALSLMQEWSQWQQQRGRNSSGPAYYEEQSKRCKESFHLRFWYAPGGYLYDAVDGPDGDDTAFRPNQLLALSLRYPVLDKEYWQAVFELVTQRLLTPYGLRTLAPEETGYQGQLKGNQEEQLRALHQGSAWPWLIGPYVDAMLNIQDSISSEEQTEAGKLTSEYWWRKSLQRLEPFRRHFHEGLLGMVGGVYDGDTPQQAGYSVTSALSTGEILRVYNLLARKNIRQPIDLALIRRSPVTRL